MSAFKQICDDVDKLVTFDVELMYACGEAYLCVFHDKSSEDFAHALHEISQVAHMIKSVVSKYYANDCVLGECCITSCEHGDVSFNFKMEKPALSKKELKAQYGIDCKWENEWSCPNQHDCIDFGECVYLQEWEDRCL